MTAPPQAAPIRMIGGGMKYQLGAQTSNIRGSDQRVSRQQFKIISNIVLFEQHGVKR